MDLLAHALYGATLCSRTGLAGGRRGGGRRDWTVPAALGFGVLPDVASMGGAFALFLLNGANGHFFRDFDGGDLVLYRYMHSLLTALLGSGILYLCRRNWSVPSLAWAVHIGTDALTHSSGKFQTLLFYPLSCWGYDGLRWWEHGWLLLGYWLALPVIWWGLSAWRRRARNGVAR